jgi:hypothetical protein
MWKDRLDSELGKEVLEELQPASNLHTSIVVLLCKGVRRGAGERWRHEREQAGEVRNPASSDLPTQQLICCVQYLISQSLERTHRMDGSRTPRRVGNEEKGFGQMDVHLNILVEMGTSLVLPRP